MNDDAGQQPGVTIPPVADPAWRAYCEMLASKDAHFSALEAINRKREQGLQPTLAETTHLGGLLEAHDAAVKAFRSAMAALDAGDRAILAQALASLNQDLGADSPPA